MNTYKKRVFYIMGVSGCGKSTIGKLLADELKLPFFDGDDYHPEANIEKMSKGIPLVDEDRFGWLQILNKLACQHKETGAVIACSTLKESYRKILKEGITENAEFVFLDGSFELIMNRLKMRSQHFMPTKLLKSQFDDLEPPKNCIRISIEDKLENIVSNIIKHIRSDSL